MGTYWDAFLADLNDGKIPNLKLEWGGSFKPEDGWLEDPDRCRSMLLEAFFDWLVKHHPAFDTSHPHLLKEVSWAYDGVSLHATAEITMGNEMHAEEIDSEETFMRIAKGWKANMLARDAEGMTPMLEMLRILLKAALEPVNAEISHLVKKDPSAKE